MKQRQLKDLILQKSISFTVIDVRDEDRLGGHIPASLNFPASCFEGDVVEHLVNRYVELKDRHSVVFHCRHSLNRAPICARTFKQRLDFLRPDHLVQVFVLEFGFEGWVIKFANNEQLVEDYIHSVWSSKLENVSPIRRMMYHDDSDSELADGPEEAETPTVFKHGDDAFHDALLDEMSLE